MRYLFVGDPHATPEELDDCRQLTALIWGLAKRHDATVLLAGDLYHTHAIIHAEVQYFWWDFLEDLKNDGVEAIIIKGNHDAPSIEDTPATALLTHMQQAAVVAWEPVVRQGILFCPYTTAGQLVAWSAEFPECKTLVCHQTFNGSVYENGFFAGDGVDPNLIQQNRVISGHIHSPQEFGKIWYPGAPRWRTLSDANTSRALWLLDFDDAGNLVDKQSFTTGDVCRQIFHFVDTPATPVTYKPVDNAEYRVDIHGPQAWLEMRKPVFEALGARVRTVRTDSGAAIQVKESEGIPVAFGKWLDVFQPRLGTDKAVLKKLVEERLNGW